MLQHGAARVYAVDVGHGQLHPRLRADSRVVVREGTDIRDWEKISRFIGDSPVHFCSIDVSFISIERILDSLCALLAPGAAVVCLIKPQFEAGRAAVGKNGVVRRPADQCRAVENVCRAFAVRGFGCGMLDFSPITGGEGNLEFLGEFLRGSGGDPPAREAVADLVERARRELSIAPPERVAPD